MKVLFVHVSRNWQGRVYPEYPLGPGLIATLARQAGYEVTFFDMAVDDTPIEDVIARTSPDVTALSFLSTSATAAGSLIKRLRTLPAGRIVVGGIHTSIFPEHALHLGADVACIGEGEPVILPLLAALSGDGFPSEATLGSVPSIAWRDPDGAVHRSKPWTGSVDVETLPPVDRDIFDLARYPHHSIITSRGCPYRCKFCCAWGPGGKKGRMASPGRILNELEALVARYGAMTMYWADDMFFFSQTRRLEFCRMMRERDLPIKWIAQLRADNLNDELVEAMRLAGCEKVCLGAESGSDLILEGVDKGLKAKDIHRGIRCAVDGGLRVKTWWIVGLPGGSTADQLASIDLIDRSRPHEVAVHTFVPLPGTVYWDDAARFGIGLPSLDSLENLYYYGSPRDVRLDYLSPDEMDRLIDTFDDALAGMGYVPTDSCAADAPFVYTSPRQRTTFTV